jgi:hypothetical protein
MHNVFGVNMEQRNADHCENSKNMLFRNELFLIALDNVCKTLAALFHNDVWKVMIIFDNIYYALNHGMIESS